jgi:hypothetical protein
VELESSLNAGIKGRLAMAQDAGKRKMPLTYYGSALEKGYVLVQETWCASLERLATHRAGGTGDTHTEHIAQRGA